MHSLTTRGAISSDPLEFDDLSKDTNFMTSNTEVGLKTKMNYYYLALSIHEKTVGLMEFLDLF